MVRDGIAGSLVVYVVAGALGLAAPQSPPADSGQIFRAGVRLVAFDVLVVDKDRRPVHGLTAADFIVTENGDPERLDAVTEVNMPTPDPNVAPWVREAGYDVVSNTLDARRLILIVLNDAYMGIEHGEPKSVREIAYGIIDQLGPNDLAAVTNTYFGRMENFTNDRAKLRKAVDAFRPHAPGRAMGPPAPCTVREAGRNCLLDTLGRAANLLKAGPLGRKFLMLIGGDVGLGENFETAVGPVTQLVRDLQAANVSVYTFNPAGLVAGSGGRTDDEYNLAAQTGGRRVGSTNTPEQAVADIFAENASYYLIGYESTHLETDGQFRRTRVRVNRPGLEVISRSGYFGPSKPSTKAPKPPAVPLEDQALARFLATGDLPMTVTATALRTPDHLAEVVAVVTLQEPVVGINGAAAGPPSPRLNLVMGAFDGLTYESRGVRRQSLDLTLAPGAMRASTYEVAMRMPAKPGRYELRFAADRAGAAGSVFVSLDVPNFEKEPLSGSSVLLERQPPIGHVSGQTLSDVIPIVPTTSRQFTRGTKVGAFLALYQGGSKAPASVSVTSEIRNQDARVVVTETSMLTPDRFGPRRAAEYRFAIPVDSLTPGAYLLTTRARLDKHVVERMVRFAIQ